MTILQLLKNGVSRLLPAARPANRIAELDGIKAIIINLVVLYHIFWMLNDYMAVARFDQLLLSPIMPAILNLNTIIDGFFLIAAFLNARTLMQLFESGRFHYGRYILGRLLRFTPVLAVVVLIYILAGMKNPSSCWSNLLYLNNFLPFDEQCMLWSWYLSIQEQYLLVLAPFLTYLLYRFRRRTWFVLLFLGVVLVFFFRYQLIIVNGLSMPVPFNLAFDSETFKRFFTTIYTLPHTRLLPLLVGTILGWASLKSGYLQFLGSIRRRWLLPLLLAFLVIFLPGFFLVSPHHGSWVTEIAQMNLALYRHLSTLFWLLLISLLLSKNRLFNYPARFLRWRGWYPLSELSLLIYLYHLIVIELLYRVVEPAQAGFMELMLYYLITLIITYIMAIVTNIFLERVIRDWIKRRYSLKQIQNR